MSMFQMYFVRDRLGCWGCLDVAPGMGEHFHVGGYRLPVISPIFYAELTQ